MFDHDDLILALDIAGAQVREVADVDADYQESGSYGFGSLHRFGYGFYADVSPDGSRVVYSTCEYIPDKPEPGRYSEGYEIAAVNIDGTDKKRLTNNEHLNHYPIWSPDGTQVAIVADDAFEGFGPVIMSADSPAEWQPLHYANWVAMYPPVWSPDGQRLAFIANEGEFRDDGIAGLYVIGSNGEGLTRIGDANAPAAWSPDGEELAFASVDGDAPIIYAVRPDGTGMRTVWRGEPNIPPEPVSLVSQISWSPDGSELLFLVGRAFLARKEGLPIHYDSAYSSNAYYTDEAYLVRSDGTDPRRLPLGVPSTRAAWSPDGSRIALYQPGRHIVTVSRDGTDLRFLVRVDEEGRIHALDQSLSERPVNLAACSAGHVVPEPEANPGLVHDCEVLLSVRDRLGGGTELGWSESTPMREWEGITLGGEPPRVHELILPSHDLSGIVRDKLTGTLPPELGGLTELRTLHLSVNYLNGSIPPELGNLTELSTLNLSANYLDGSIPPELGGLTKLRWLDLSNNYFSGSIPPELDNLTNLRMLYLSYNRFTGCIPTALRSIEDEDLGSLYLPNCEEAVSP